MKRRKDDPDGLTPREWQVLALIRDGLTNEEIAERLGISFGTAKYHVAEILSKLGADDRRDAVRKADERRWAPVVLAWLAVLRRFAWPAVAVSLIALIGISYILVSGLNDGVSGTQPQLVDEAAGLDISPQTLAAVEQARATTEFKRTLLLSHGPPARTGTDKALIDSLPRVSTLAELQALLTPDVRVIAVDASAASELAGTSFLREQWEAGRAIVGINLCFADLPEEWRSSGSPKYRGVVTEIAPDGTKRYIDTSNRESVGRCKWAYDLADAGYPYISYLPRPLSLAEAEELRGRGVPAVPFGSMGRLDLPPEFELSCYVSGLFAHLERSSTGQYAPLECP